MDERELKITSIQLAEKTLKALSEDEDTFVLNNKNLPLNFQIIREAVQEYEKFQIYEDNYRDLIIRVTSDLKIRFISKSCKDITGFDPAEIVGRKLEDFLFEEKNYLLNNMQDNAGYHKKIKVYLHRFKSKTGDTLWLETSVNMIKSRDDITIEYLMVSRDITKRKKIEINLKEKSSLLENAYEELSMISHAVSHDLRAPLRRIDGYTQILQEDHHGKFNDIEKDLIFRLRKNVSNMGRIIDSFLFFLSLGTQKLNKMMISIPKILEEIRKNNYKNIEFIIKSVPFIQADPNLIKILLKEIINNSQSSAKRKEKLKVEIGCISGKNNEEKVIYIKDNGYGIKKKYIETIFEPFISLSNKKLRDDLGMGLTICRRIMKLHEGRIEAQSEEEGGFIIFLFFPVSEKAV